MGITERRAREKDALREKIIQAAIELFLTEGFSNVSMRRIAERIEYSAATIYLHFKNKEDLMAAICAQAFEQLIERLQLIENNPDLSTLERLVGGLRTYIEFGLTHPHQYRLVFGEFTPPEVQSTPESSSLGLEALFYMTRCIERCRADGSLAPGDSSLDTMSVWMAIHGVTIILINDFGRWELPWPAQNDLIDRSLEIILRGLGAKQVPALVAS